MMGKGQELWGIFRVWLVLRELGRVETHLENNQSRIFLEKFTHRAYRIYTHFIAKNILQVLLSVGLSDEPYADAYLYKVRTGSSGVHPPPISIPLSAIKALSICLSENLMLLDTRCLSQYMV